MITHPLFIIFIISYIIMMIININTYKKEFIFQNVIISLWSICSILSMFGFYDMYVPNDTTYILILSFIYAFEIFSILSFKYLKEKKNIDYQKTKEIINYKVINTVLIFGILLWLILSFNNIKTLFDGGNFSSIRNSYLNSPPSLNKIKMFISLLVSPIIGCFGYIAIIKAIENKKINLSVILYMIFITINLLYKGGRSDLIFLMAFVFLALLDNYNFSIKEIVKNNKKLIFVGLIGIAIVIYITLQRNLEGKGLLYNIYAYFVGSIHMLGVYIKNPVVHNLMKPDMYGQILLSGFIYPITFILRLFGCSIKAGLYVVNDTTQIFERISPYTSINNNVTFIYSALRDFGYFGIYIYTLIITFLYKFIRNKKRETNSVYLKAMFYIFIIEEVFLLFMYNFSNTGVVVGLTFLYIMYKRNNKIVYLKEEKLPRIEEDDLISFVVPVYNVEQYLEDCIYSVTNQNYKNIEILLINDGSTDNSLKICNELAKQDKRIKVFDKKNEGLSATRNLGIKEAKGKYITFIDSDDDISKDYTDYLYSLIKKYNSKMSIASYSVVSKNKVIDLSNGYEEELLSTSDALDRLLSEKGFTVSAVAKMYEKSLFDDIEYPYGKYCEDNGTTYKLIMKCDKIPYGNKSVYNYYKRDNSIMTSKFNMKKIDLIELTDKMGEDILKEYPELKNVVEKKKITSRFSILRQMLVQKLNKEERIEAKKIEKYIKKRKKYILTRKEFDKRDKVALLTLLLGHRFFAFSWKIYTKIVY